MHVGNIHVADSHGVHAFHMDIMSHKTGGHACPMSMVDMHVTYKWGTCMLHERGEHVCHIKWGTGT